MLTAPIFALLLSPSECGAKLELAAWRFLADRKVLARDGEDAICKAMDLGMTWPLGCLGMPEGYRAEGG